MKEMLLVFLTRTFLSWLNVHLCLPTFLFLPTQAKDDSYGPGSGLP